jgi:hypothetical protein
MDKERAVSNEDFYAFETAQRKNIKFWQMIQECLYPHKITLFNRLYLGLLPSIAFSC